MSPARKSPLERGSLSLENVNMEDRSDDQHCCNNFRANILRFCAVALYTFGGINYSMIAPFFPIEAQKKDLSSTETGIIFSCFALFMIITGTIIPVGVPRFGAGFIWKCGLLLDGLSTLVFGLLYMCPPGGPFLALSMVIRSAQAVGFSALLVAGNPVLSELFPQYETIVSGIQQTFFNLGVLIGPGVGSVFYSTGGFGLPFYVAGGAALLNAVPIILTLESKPLAHSPPVEENNDQPSSRRWILNPLVFVACLNIVIVGMSLSYIEPVFSLELKKLHMSSLSIGGVFMISPVVCVFCLPLQEYLVNKKDYHLPVLIANGAVCAISILIVGPSPLLPLLHQFSTPHVIIAMVLLGMGTSVIAQSKSFMQGVAESGLESSAETFSMAGAAMSISYNTGGFLGALFGGYFYDTLGFPWSCTVFACFTAFTTSLTLIYLLWRVGYKTYTSNGEVGEHSWLVNKQIQGIATKNTTASTDLPKGSKPRLQILDITK